MHLPVEAVEELAAHILWFDLLQLLHALRVTNTKSFHAVRKEFFILKILAYAYSLTCRD